jgi:hypothetical protein
MKRGRKPATPAPGGIPKALAEFAEEKLRGDYLAFVAGTTTEDPKQFLARIAAAREALDHLAQLRALAGDEQPDDPASDTDAVIEAARAGMASEDQASPAGDAESDENKS